MTLLNSILAFGALAFTIPLAIHLLHRSRFKTIDWGAWHLLDSVIRINRRRMQLTHWLLLLLRCAIPILLAFCLARPVLTGFESLPGDAPQTLVLAIDDSRSMNAALSGQNTRLQQAKDQLTEFLKKRSRRDEVIWVTSSSVQSPPSTMGAGDAIEKLSTLKASGGPVDLSLLVDAAVGAAQQASHAQTSILLVSDFQSCNVSKSTMNTLDGVALRLRKIVPQPAVGFWDLGGDWQKLTNVSVDSITVDSPAVVAGRSTQFSTRLRNASDLPTGELRVVWSIDGIALPPRIVSMDARSSATARLSHRIDEPGVCEVTVSVEKGDSLAEDNRRSVAVDVIREINVILVDGKPSNRPLEGQADFLALALSPFAFGGDDQPDSVRTQIISESRIGKTLAQQTPEIVVLANVASLSDETKSELASFVDAGGSLVIFDGDRVKISAYNSVWKNNHSPLTLPATLGDIVGTPANRDTTATTINELNPQYSPWNLLQTGDERPLADVEVFAYRKLSLQNQMQGDQQSGPTAAAVLLRAADGSPLVVMARRGRGQVCQFAIPCDASWTTLPMRLSFLPMMQQMVLDLAGRRKTTTLMVGQPISIATSELKFFDPADANSPGNANASNENKVSYTVDPPDAAETAIRPIDSTSSGNRSIELRWTKTQTSGVYTFRAIRGDAAKRVGGKRDSKRENGSDGLIQKTIRVVEVPEAESRLRSTAPDGLAAVAAKIDATMYTNLDDLANDDHTRRFGREIWRWLLVLLLIAMVGEIFLQQHLVGRSSTAGSV